MLLLEAYLDDSGKSDDPQEAITCIAGAISPLKAWEDLEEEWKHALTKFDVPYLHMKEYAHSSSGSPFAKWKGKEDRRREFLSALMDTMDRHVMSVIGATIPNEQFRRLTLRQQQRVRDPYFMCFQQTLHAAGSMAFAVHETEERTLQVPDPQKVEKIKVIFSKQQEFKSEADSFHEVMQTKSTIGPMLGSFTWGAYKDVIPLQVADLVAYEMKTFASTLVDDQRTNIRVPMKRLFSINPLFQFFNYNEIVKRFYFSGPAFHP